MILSGKKIVIGVTGGVAAYKIPELIRRLKENGAEVQVVMTEAAQHFIGLATLQAVSGNPVYTHAWDAREANYMPHINITRGADMVLVAPCTADFLAKLAQGIADDLLSSLCLAASCPILTAPAMNKEMWEKPSTQRNVATLKQDGITLLGPASGEQACGETGLGRMLEPDHLLYEIQSFFVPKVLQGVHCLLTAGPTVEPIDPVRVISNRSSGKMGYALAQAAQMAGATVTLISGPTALADPFATKVIRIETAQEMLAAVMQTVQHAQIFISVAAVADWYLVNPAPHKIKKQHTQGHPFNALEWSNNPDILASVAALDPAPFCVGFAAESENLAAYAAQKRLQKNIPLIIGNLVQDALANDHTQVLLMDASGSIPIGYHSKNAMAHVLMQHIAERYQQSSLRS